MLRYILDTLAPICLLILAGVLLRKGKFAPKGFFQELNRLVYWVGLPALLLEKTARVEISGAEPLRMFALLAMMAFICLALGYGIAWAFRLRGRAGPIVQGGFRGNLVYIGLPVLLFSLSDQTPERAAELAAFAVLALAPIVPLYNVLSVIVLVADTHKSGDVSLGKTLRHMLLRVATNPLLLSCVLGLLLAGTGIALPVALQRTLSAAGQMALPLSLVAIGATLSLQGLHVGWKPVLATSVLKVFVSPVIGYLLGTLVFGLSGAALRSILIFIACPTAVASYVMTDQLGGDAEQAARIVILTTLLALPGLALVLALA